MKLTNLEIKIMQVMWDNGNDMTIQEIASCLTEEKISTASVAQAIKRLLAKKAIMVSEHILVSNVYARTFKHCITREDFFYSELKNLEKTVSLSKRISSIGMVAAILQNNTEEKITQQELDTLQKLIDQKKSSLKDKGE